MNRGVRIGAPICVDGHHVRHHDVLRGSASARAWKTYAPRSSSPRRLPHHLPGHRDGGAPGVRDRRDVEDPLPFYRPRKLYARIGADLSRGKVCAWAITVARACRVLLERL